MDMVNSLYGNKYKQLQHSVWEKGFKGGHIGAEQGLSIEAVEWLDKAIYNYHSNRIGNILVQIGKKSDDVVLKQWNALLDELCGKDATIRSEFIDNVIKHPHCTPAMKEWLMKTKTR
ncbi:MAG: hypothetical protein ACD_29C00086G0004 [uncultured bacterium]|nr:MAG: hypothetical protein ACD_29C00086G0004 [uncultured bacterium]